MRTLSTFLRSGLLFFVALCMSTGAYATHILAMDLFYTWQSGNTYKITAVIYGDCGPSSSGSFSLLGSATPEVCILRSGLQVSTIGLTIEAPFGEDVTPVCPAQIGRTQCQDMNSTIPGITRFVYSAMFTLPAPVADEWRFVFTGNLGNSQAGRSNNITNILNPGSSLMQLVAVLDNRFAANNNSNAKFSVIPTPFFCLNENDTYNPGAVDPDGDSLKVIDLVPAIEGPLGCQAGTPVNYIGTAWNPPFTPISAQTPLSVLAGSFIYDVTTGQLNFRPNIVQRSTVVYNVQEYRNGQFIGSSQREMNFLVQSCSQTPPTGGIVNASSGLIVDSAHYIGCRNSGPFTFQFNPRESNPLNNITVSSTGLPPGATLVTTNNGTPTPRATFSWSTTGTAAGVYIFYITYTDDNCPLQGTTTTAISVTIQDSMTVTHNVLASTTCAAKEVVEIIPHGGGSPWTINITGTPPHTFTGVTGSVFDSLEPGTHIVTISSTFGVTVCNAPDTIIVPSAEISGDTTVCSGSSIMLSDGVAGGTWSSGNTSIATVISSGAGAGMVTGVSAGRVAISYSFPGGCFKTATVTVRQLPSPISGNMQVCTGRTTVLSDTTAGGIWTSGTPVKARIDSFSGVVTGVDSGVAIISYSNAGCFVTASVTVELQPTLTTGSPNICTDGITILTSWPTGGTWSTSNTAAATIILSGSGSDTVAGVFTGVTLITYTLGGCSSTVTVNVVEFLPPVTGPDRVCTGQSIVLSNEIIGGTWASTNTAVATVNDTAGAVIGVSPGLAVISYTIGGSCISTASVTVNQSPDVGVITGLKDVCVGLQITLSDTVAGGTWELSNANATVSGDTVTGVLPGIDTVFYIVSNLLCTDSATTEITVHAVPNEGIIVGPSVLCEGEVTTFMNSAPGGVWSSAVTTVATITAAGVTTGVAPGVDTIKYTVSNPGCAISATHEMTVYEHPDAGTITGLRTVCAGSVFNLSDSVSGGVWSSNNTTVAAVSDSGKITPGSPGTAVIRYITGPNAGGCYGIATYTVTILPERTLVIDPEITVTSCYGAKDAGIAVSVANAQRPLEYLWSNGSTDTFIMALDPGQYILSVTEAARLCKAADTFTITQPDTLVMTAEVKQDICKQHNGSIVTTVTGGTTPYQYLWSDNSTGKDLEQLQAGSYSVTLTDDHGCTQRFSGNVTDNDCIINVFNAITPNGDGINDKFVIEGIDNYPTSTVQIFDKWGDIVYSKVGYNNDWSGQGKGGTLLPDGSYYYIVKLNTTNLLGGSDTFTGTILIKR